MSSVRQWFDAGEEDWHISRAMDIWDFALSGYEHVLGPPVRSFFWRQGHEGEKDKAVYVAFSSGGIKPEGAECVGVSSPVVSILATLAHVLDYLTVRSHVNSDQPEIIVWRDFRCSSRTDDNGKAEYTTYARFVVLPPGAVIVEEGKSDTSELAANMAFFGLLNMIKRKLGESK